MKIKYNIIPKEDVKFVTDKYTIREAAEELEETGYRCIPILDESGTSFLGNIYAQDVYKAIVKNQYSWDDSVMLLKEDEDVHTGEQASFIRIFSKIKKYPYLAVLHDDNTFAGILTHANVMEILEDSWGVKTGSYTLNVSTQEYQGALNSIFSAIKKITGVQSLLTLDNESKFFRRVILTLPRETTEETLEKVVTRLEKEGFRVFEVEKI